ncbi:hypothetical protein KUV89_17665 [Marinobacter hydrocarbonoclasticus]|nr:hypothetical protein [Marinobacter nauticus]
MSLLNLKRTSPSVSNREAMTAQEQEEQLEAFINGAVAYGAGKGEVVSLSRARPEQSLRSRKANFSLNEPAIERLTLLAQHTGIPKSRLIRIWLDQIDWNRDLERYLTSNTP